MTDQGTLFPNLPAPTKRRGAGQKKTGDSFQNFSLNLGLGTNNALTGSTYGFNPITRIRTLLEWMYRGSWVAGVSVDVIPDDMTREGAEILSDHTPEQIEQIERAAVLTGVWDGINENSKWARLYGGSVLVMLVDGQDMETPLREETVGKGQFKGVTAVDRWWLSPSFNERVTDYGPRMGEPKFYQIFTDVPGIGGKRVHYSRTIRQLGVGLPRNQRIMEDGWGLSILERVYDRLIAFDSATQGAAQLAYKSYLRTLKVDGMREIMGAGGSGQDAAGAMLQRYTDMMRFFQGIEGITLIDGKDDFEVQQSSAMTGLSDILLQFCQQIAGALQIPAVRLFGQSPAGLNATGDSDIRLYYDNVAAQQKKELLTGVNVLYRMIARGEGLKVDDKFAVRFRPLYQMTDGQKAEIDEKMARTIGELEERGVLPRAVALRELRQIGRKTGSFQNISESVIKDAEEHDAAPPGEHLLAAASAVSGNGPVQEEGADPSAPREQLGSRSSKAAPREGGIRGPANERTTPAGDMLPTMTFQGLQVVIENGAGDIRKGPGWAVRMPAAYGFIRGTSSAEGLLEQMDCFIGPDANAPSAFVVDSADPRGVFDEHKVMLGFSTKEDAERVYRAAYHDARVPMAITAMTIAELQEWMVTGDLSRPVSPARPVLVASR